MAAPVNVMSALESGEYRLSPPLPRSWPPDCGVLFVLTDHGINGVHGHLVAVFEVDLVTAAVTRRPIKYGPMSAQQEATIELAEQRAMFELLATQRQAILAPQTSHAYARWAIDDPARAAAAEQAGSGFFASLARDDISLGPDLVRAIDAVSIEIGDPVAVEFDPFHLDLMLDRSGCARVVLDAKNASERAHAHMLELGFDDTGYIGHGHAQHLSALLPTGWPPDRCEALFYVIETGNSPNGIVFPPSTKAWITVNLETGDIHSGTYGPGHGARGPTRVPDYIGTGLQDQLFAVIGRARAPQVELVSRYLADLSPSELDDLARWHPGLVDALPGREGPGTDGRDTD